MHTGLKYALLACIISGFSVYLNSTLVKGIDPLLFTTLKNTLVSVGIIALLIYQKQTIKLIALPLSDWLKLLLISLIGGSLAFGLFFTGLASIGAASGALIQKTLVIWIMLQSVIILKEKLSYPLVLLVIGLFLTSILGGNKIVTWQLGHTQVLLATLLWSVEAILVKRFLNQLSPSLLLFGRMGLGSLWLTGYLLFTGRLALIAQIAPNQWPGIILVSLVLFAYVTCWYQALSRLSATTTATILTGSLVITTILSTLNTGKFTGVDIIKASLVSLLLSAFIFLKPDLFHFRRRPIRHLAKLD